MADANALDLLPVSDADLGALSGFTARHVRTICATAKVGRNAYAAGPAIRLIFDHHAAGGELGKRLLTERIRKVAADADQAELDFALARGDVAPIAEMARIWERQCGTIQANILNVPARAVLQLLGECDESTFKQILRAELILALEQSAQAEIIEEDLEDEQTNEK